LISGKKSSFKNNLLSGLVLDSTKIYSSSCVFSFFFEEIRFFFLVEGSGDVNCPSGSKMPLVLSR